MRRRFFALFTICLSLGASLFAAEWLLSYQRHAVESSDRLDHGMIVYDPRLGWRLKPGWFGSHRHHDFEVDYSINRFGFRGRPPRQTEARRWAVVGDSFTFGQGVGEEQTFVHLLGETGRGTEFLNFGVPGYSTDQQYLLIRDRIRLFKPDLLLLVVYLGNDLFDNERPFPLQGDHAKPYFRLSPDGTLALLNSPVPRESRPAAAGEEGLAALVLDGLPEPASKLELWLGGFEITRRMGLFQPVYRGNDEPFEGRFDYHLALFLALVERIAESAGQSGAGLTVALLPGRSFVENPDSLSAGYQDFLRRRLLQGLSSTREIEVIDLATALRDARERGNSGLYYPNEGHLTPAGHALLAGLLAERLPPGRQPAE